MSFATYSDILLKSQIVKGVTICLVDKIVYLCIYY